MKARTTEHVTWSPLRDLVRIRLRQVVPSEIEADAQYVGLEHIEAATGFHQGVRAGSAELRSHKYRFDAGDILFGKLRPNLRKVTVALGAGVCSTDIVPMTPVDAGAAYLIAFQLRSRPVTDAIVRLVAGGNLPRVAVRDLLDVMLPVPNASGRERAHALAASLHEAEQEARRLTSLVRELHEAAERALVPDDERVVVEGAERGAAPRRAG